MERRIIRISNKRQITIPQKYFEALGLSNEAECYLQDGSLVIRPVKMNAGGEFAEQILKDLIGQGYQGEDLLVKFKETNMKIRPAIEVMLDEAEQLAKSENGATMSDVFGTED